MTVGEGNAAIYVLSGPVQTGKTTRLRAWCDDWLARAPTDATYSSVDGILAPVVGGHRHLLHIPTGTMRDLEDFSDGAPAVTVRRFTFNAGVFAWARNCLLGAVTPPSPPADRVRWIIVDEVGPLELSGGGLEPAVSELLRVVGFGRGHTPYPGGVGDSLAGSPGDSLRVVLVIREDLVDDALMHLGLPPTGVPRFPFA